MAEVSLLRTASYEQQEVQASIDRHFALLGVDKELGPHTRVAVKPNLIMRCGPDRAATTHPAVLEAVLHHLKELGVGEVVVADSPGGVYTPGLLRSAYELTGYWDAALRQGARCNTETGSAPVRCASSEEGEAALCREFDIIDPIRNADYVINLCKVKTHCMMTYTGGVKNLFGCIPGLQKPALHYRFPQEEQFAKMLVDLSLTIRPALTIADGVIGMEGDGPTAGKPHPLGVTAAARFSGLYDLDVLLAGMIGLTPDRVPVLREAMERGLCGRDGGPEILGDASLTELVEPFLLPAGKDLDFSGNVPGVLGTIVRALKPRLTPRPVIRTKDCVGCGKCAETCPANTIVVEGKKARILPEKCIKCFCCHELCPVKAIDVKSPGIFRLFSR